MSENKNYESEYIQIKARPYGYIGDFMEKNLMHIGRKCFQVASLMNISLLLPNIQFGSSDIRSNINLIYISPSGSGKSSLCKKFEMISYFPLKRRSISAAELQMKAVEMKLLTIIIEDFSQTVDGTDGYETVKVLEGITGEEQSVQKSNMRIELLGDVKAVAFYAGTPHDLEKYIKSMEGGLLSRCMVLYHYHTTQQHKDIGKYINDKIGEKSYSENMNLSEEVVKNYYKELQEIQEGKHSSIKPIKYYSFSPEIKKKIYAQWENLSEKLMEDMGDRYWIRDLQDAYRILVASSFLNVFNRKVEDNTLYPNDEDLALTLKLMRQNMNYKWSIMKAVAENRKIRTPDMLRLYLTSSNVPQSVKNILINISRYSGVVKDILEK